MPYDIRRVDYFNTTIRDRPGEGYKLLAQLAELGLNLVAFTAVPVGPSHTQLTLFPEDTGKMVAAARRPERRAPALWPQPARPGKAAAGPRA